MQIWLEGLSLYPHAVELHVGMGYARLAREEYAWARRAFDEAGIRLGGPNEVADLPFDFPQYCLDLKQWAIELGEPALPVPQGVKPQAYTGSIPCLVQSFE